MTRIFRILFAVVATGFLGHATVMGSIPVNASGGTHASSYALDGAAYSQDFNSLPSAGTFTWANDSNLSGWFAANSAGGLNTAAVTITGSGNAAALILASVGTSGSADRALSYHTQVDASPTHLGLAFTNNSGQELTSFTLSYSPEQWREASTTRSVTVTVQYKVGATLADLHVASGWTAIAGLDFSTFNGSVSSATTLTATGIPVAVPPGASLWIRWRFSNTATVATNAHDLLAIDNVVFSAAAGTPVETAPAILDQPLSRVVSAGESVTFAATASGYPAPAFQWFKGTEPIEGATSSSYTILSASADDAGDYSVSVRNSLGSDTSGPATLTISDTPPPPVILTHPAGVTASAGQSVAFVVVAGGPGPLTYQWFKGPAAIAGATAAVHTISSVTTADAGFYTVAVTHAATTVTSSAATLGILTGGGDSSFNLYGFATLGSGTTGGGVIPETDVAYRKCATPLEFVTAIRDSNKTAGAVKVIEITADMNLGWNEIDAATKALASVPIRSHAVPKLHPTLIASGVSVLDVVAKSGLTIFSANGATVRHVTLNIKSTSDIIIRNLKFDGMWEWDEATKGDYDSNDWDFMVLSNGGVAKNVWIDHCTFTKAYDGIADMKKGTEYVTLSWCKYVGDDGATNPNSHVRVQVSALEADKAAYPFYNFLRTNGFSQEEIIQIVQGHDKGHLMGATEKAAENSVLSATFHHQWFQNLWDRCVPRLRGGQVHNYNIFVDDSTALIANRLRKSRADAMSSAARSTLNNTYNFNPFLNGSISTEGGAILVEKSIYQDCLTPLRNNQTDVSDPTYTGKIKSTDTIYVMHNTNGTTTTVRGDSTDPGSPMGPFQAPAILFSWNTPDGSRPYPAPPMDDPAELPEILAAGAGAGTLAWPKENWLMTSYAGAPATDHFAAWSARNALSDPHDDPDGDGIENLVEFSLGLNPNLPSTDGLPALVSSAGQSVFRFTRPNNLSGLGYTVETSADLVNWSGSLPTSVESSTATTETLVASVPNGEGKLLVRLRINRQ
jgi:pectate lyase